MAYRVHRFYLRMTQDEERLEEYLNRLEGEVVAIIPNVTPVPATYVDFVLIVERLPEPQPAGEGPWPGEEGRAREGDLG